MIPETDGYHGGVGAPFGCGQGVLGRSTQLPAGMADPILPPSRHGTPHALCHLIDCDDDGMRTGALRADRTSRPLAHPHLLGESGIPVRHNPKVIRAALVIRPTVAKI
jgi:hypothetical protein